MKFSVISNKYYRVIVVAAFLLVAVSPSLAKGYTVDQIPNVVLADSTKLVSDPDGVLAPEVRNQVDSILVDIRRQSTAQVAIVIIGNMEPKDQTDVDAFATELFEKWGIGMKDKDNGLLLLIVKDEKKFCFRTGYGVEGILPDMICRRIADEKLVPAFKQEQYGEGILATAERLHELMTSEAARNELYSQIELEQQQEWEDFCDFLWLCAICVTIFSAGLLIFRCYLVSDKTNYDKYQSLRPMRGLFLVLTVFGLLMPLPVFLILLYLLHKWRNGNHLCPNCKTAMKKLDEDTDNQYLTPAQDAEERLKSVDYDVWLCPNCGTTDIYSFVNKAVALNECPFCHARTMHLEGDRVVVNPTEHRQGRGVKEYRCLNCGHHQNVSYVIAKLASAVVVGGVGGGGFGSSGGGGGSFGGGSTGGGGYSGGW